MTADQVVRYARVGERDVAWSAIGSGPPLVIGGWWASHLTLNWEDHAFRTFVQALAMHHTVIRYDRPGTGLSDRDGPPSASLDDEIAVLVGLLRAIGQTRVTVLGGSSGCGAAAACAAEHPELVERLVLYGSFANGADIASPSAKELLVAVVERHWGLGARVLADVFLPNATAVEREEFAEFQRRSSSREDAAAALRAVYELDSTAHLARVRTPTLVAHRRDDRAIPFALGREVADLVPDATFVELAGEDHFPWRGDSLALVEAIERFLDGLPPLPPAEQRAAATLTPREREVLMLVAQGLTDAQIAERLVLSAHTVHRHVANVRTKLGVSSRAAAAAWVSTHER
ncbi:LuxR family transcriptional regulator [Knoellia sinensis KCTC 19936]|uniref:LuxR family transcriptional regulator n=1 Tax=Knoellia sinensis KCTC 19936 TaxID=1385520 RepID=A0A0A0JDQ5_9MICO|nr:alpha/beta fold hydrolase [Knoellia sinensis]KGN34167.1 LuxR family transcriptional regulator [Knoellia sinensis KCTC 19936]